MALSRGQSDIHTTLIQTLKNHLTLDGLADMKDKCKTREYGGLGAGQLERIQTVPALLEKLEQKRVFKEGNYQKLKGLLHAIEDNAAVDMVKAAEQELVGAGHHVDGYPPAGAQAMDQGHQVYRHPSPHDPYKPPPYHSLGASVDPQARLPFNPPGPYNQYSSMHHAAGPGVQHRSDAFPSFSGPPDVGYQATHQQQMPLGQISPPGGAFASHHNQYASPVPTYQAPNQNIPPHAVSPNTNQSNHARRVASNTYPGGRGLILFINNHFRNGSPAGTGEFDHREGADVDTKTVRETCRDYLPHHELVIEEEVGQNKFAGILDDAKLKLIRGDYTSFMLIISSHGELTQEEEGQTQRESIVLVDSSKVTLKEIKDRFSADQVPKLIGKPKVYIIQACRGLSHGRGVPDRSDCMGRANPQNLNTASRLTRPDNADVLVAYATSEGTRSWRNSEEGTWYINHLFRAIRENSEGDHFADLLTFVQGQIAGRETQGNPESRAKQMPCYVSTLTKKFVL